MTLAGVHLEYESWMMLRLVGVLIIFNPFFEKTYVDFFKIRISNNSLFLFSFY